MSSHRDPARYQQVKDVLLHALDAAPDKRSEYLDSACANDPALREEVELLLAAYDEASRSFLNGPPGVSGDQSTAADDDVDLTGARLGAYRLDRLLGRGGMGTVYLASRDDGEFVKRVAIKVIRRSAATPALLNRFRAERQILADIEHPHIARLLDGGTVDGMPFFVMEYVEGETLTEVLRRGPLPLARALQLAEQLADVLALIHSKGLVFRDLKPSNVMLDAQGDAKVLDFGIAKIMPGGTGEETTGHTQPGWIVGTPNYMSPEQATGEPVEASSDVFSFGIVLFQTLTGSLPFEGETGRGYVRNLIGTPARDLPTSHPRRLRELIERCLKKEPEARYPSGAELATAVRAISKQPGPRRLYVWLAAAALILTIVLLPWWRRGEVKPSMVLGAAQPLVTWASDETNPRVSPDLKWLSFISDRDGDKKIYLRDRASEEERVIAPPGGDLIGYVWSPSSNQIAYVTRTTTDMFLSVSDIVADARPQVFNLIRDAAPVRWIGDGVYFLANESLWRFDMRTRQSKEVTTARAQRLRGVDVSADERHIAYATNSASDYNRLWYADLDGGRAVALTDIPMNPRFPRWVGTRSDQLVYISDENGQADIWLMDVRTRTRQPLTSSGVEKSRIALSDDGSLLFYEQTAESAVIAELDPLAKTPGIRSLTSDSLSDLFPSASISGGFIAFQRAKRENLTISIYEATLRLSRDRFTTESETIGDGYAPEVSPNGRWVAYLVRGRSTASLKVYDVQNRKSVSVSEFVAKADYERHPFAWTSANVMWSPTKPEIYFVAVETPGHHSIMRASLLLVSDKVSTERLVEIDDAMATIGDLRISSRGDRVSYVLASRSRGTSEIHVKDLVNGKESIWFSTSSGVALSSAGWTTDDALVVLRSSSRMALVDVLTLKAPNQAGDDEIRPIGQLTDVDGSSPSLDPWRKTLYFTRTGLGVNSLHAFSLVTKQERRLLPGERHGGAFSGIRVLEDGRLLFSLQKWNSDIYSNKLAR